MKHHEVARKLRRAPKSESRDEAFRRAIRSIPRGKVATYGQVAAAAGYPLYHRHVAQLLQRSGGRLPWPHGVHAPRAANGIDRGDYPTRIASRCDGSLEPG